MARVDVSAAVPRPDHVAESVVFDYDMHADPAMRQDAHARILEIARNAPPVFWTPRNGGQWIIRGYDAVHKASRNTETFSNEPVPFEQLRTINEQLPEPQKILVPLPITIDPPHHGVYRGPLQKAFSPTAMVALKGQIRELAATLIDAVKPQGECEFMSAVAEPLPVTIFLRLFGLPTDRQHEYRELVMEHLHSIENDQQMIQRRLRKVAEAMRETILERQHSPENDVLSLLWQSEFYGKPATLHDIENFAVTLFIAGLDTVVNGIGLGVRHLASDPELQARLRADPSLLVGASEEMLRRYTFTVPPRFISRDVDFEGVQMKKGETAMLFLPAADLDPARFDEPGKYELSRDTKAHIAFGAGPHRCLGAHLARVELQILYHEMLARIPEFRLDPSRPVTFHGGHVIGPDQLHLVWDA